MTTPPDSKTAELEIDAGSPGPAAEAPAVPVAARPAAERRALWPFRLLKALISERGLPITILVALLAIMAVFKGLYTANVFGSNVDGGYYTTIALNIRDGNGFVTNLSLRHQGFDHFPHPSPIYPLWPLTYGLIAKVFSFAPILTVGKWTVTFFYFVAAVFGYLWAAKLFPGPLLPRLLPGFNAGHVFVLLFAVNRNTLIIMSQPFTEGLAYALLMFTLWRYIGLFGAPSFARGLELGLYMALLIFVRSPMVLVTMAVLPTLLFALVALKEFRLPYVKLAGGAFVSFGLAMAARFIQLRSMAPKIGLIEIIRWDNIQFSTVLSHPKALKPASGLWALLMDRADGFVTAFSPTTTYSYAHQYYTFQYALLLLIPILLVLAALRLRRRNLAPAWHSLTRPEHLYWVFIVLFAIGGFLSIHMIRRVGGSWFFNQRHALTAFFLFFLCLTFFLRSRWVVFKVCGLLFVASSMIWGGMRTYNRVEEAVEKGPKSSELKKHAKLLDWLKTQAKRDEQLVVAMRQPGPIAWRTPQIGYHNYDYRTKMSDVRAMATKLGVDYFAIPGSFGGFSRTAEFRRRFEQVGSYSGHRLFKLKSEPKPQPAAPVEVDEVDEAEDSDGAMQ